MRWIIFGFLHRPLSTRRAPLYLALPETLLAATLSKLLVPQSSAARAPIATFLPPLASIITRRDLLLLGQSSTVYRRTHPSPAFRVWNNGEKHQLDDLKRLPPEGRRLETLHERDGLHLWLNQDLFVWTKTTVACVRTNYVRQCLTAIEFQSAQESTAFTSSSLVVPPHG